MKVYGGFYLVTTDAHNRFALVAGPVAEWKAANDLMPNATAEIEKRWHGQGYEKNLQIAFMQTPQLFRGILNAELWVVVNQEGFDV